MANKALPCCQELSQMLQQYAQSHENDAALKDILQKCSTLMSLLSPGPHPASSIPLVTIPRKPNTAEASPSQTIQNAKNASDSSSASVPSPSPPSSSPSPSSNGAVPPVVPVRQTPVEPAGKWGSKREASPSVFGAKATNTNSPSMGRRGAPTDASSPSAKAGVPLPSLPSEKTKTSPAVTPSPPARTGIPLPNPSSSSSSSSLSSSSSSTLPIPPQTSPRGSNPTIKSSPRGSSSPRNPTSPRTQSPRAQSVNLPSPSESTPSPKTGVPLPSLPEKSSSASSSLSTAQKTGVSFGSLNTGGPDISERALPPLPAKTAGAPPSPTRKARPTSFGAPSSPPLLSAGSEKPPVVPRSGAESPTTSKANGQTPPLPEKPVLSKVTSDAALQRRSGVPLPAPPGSGAETSKPPTPDPAAKPTVKRPVSTSQSEALLQTTKKQTSETTVNAAASPTPTKSGGSVIRPSRPQRSTHVEEEGEQPQTPPQVPPPPLQSHSSGSKIVVGEQPINLALKPMPKPPPKSSTCEAPVVTYAKAGFVFKRKIKKGTPTKWKERYFSIHNQKICYSFSASDKEHLGEIPLVSVKTKKMSIISADKPFCFELTTIDSLYHIATRTQQDLDEWIDVIEGFKHRIFNAGEGSVVTQTIAPTEADLAHKEKSKIARPAKKHLMSTFQTLRSKTTGDSVDQGSFGEISFTRVDSGPDSPPLPVVVEETEEEIQDKKMRQYETTVKEVIDTERDYINDLTCCIKEYMGTLRDYHLLTPKQKEEIFANIEDLLPLHQDLFERLQSRSAPFSQIFLAFAPKLIIYTKYCLIQATLQTTLDQLCQNPNFQYALEDIRLQHNVKKLDLPSYLIKPMQRLCKYPLLLRELKLSLARAKPDDPEVGALEVANNAINSIVTRINESKRLTDSMAELMALQESIIEKDIFIGNKQLMHQGDLKKIVLNNVSMSKASIYLFRDVIFIMKRKEKGKLSVRAEFPLNAVIVWDLDSAGNGDSDKRNSFSLVSTSLSDSDKAICFAHSAEEKSNWIDNINQCIGAIGF